MSDRTSSVIVASPIGTYECRRTIRETSAVPVATSDAAATPLSTGISDKRQPTSRPNSSTASTRTDEPAPAAKITREFTATDFGVHKSTRYHAKRRAFFDRLHRSSMAVIAIAGSAAFFTLVGGDASVIGKIAALIAAIASTFDLTLGLPERAREHGQLYERFSELAVKVASLDPDQLAPEEVRTLRAERLTIEAAEPTSLEALNILCHNEEAEARGYSDLSYQIGWFQRLVIQFGTLPWFKLERLSPSQIVTN